MPTIEQTNTAARVPLIQCGSCEETLPLRLTVGDEPAAVWHCARCDTPFVACCVEEALASGARNIRLGARFFDVSNQAAISLSDRQRASVLASRPTNQAMLRRRRSERVSQSLVVPAVELGPGFVPVGDPFQIMVANLSREGVGLVHDRELEADFIAMEFSPTSSSPIQVIVRVVRQRELVTPYVEIGGEFLVRLGSIPGH